MYDVLEEETRPTSHRCTSRPRGISHDRASRAAVSASHLRRVKSGLPEASGGLRSVGPVRAERAREDAVVRSRAVAGGRRSGSGAVCGRWRAARNARVGSPGRAARRRRAPDGQSSPRSTATWGRLVFLRGARSAGEALCRAPAGPHGAQLRVGTLVRQRPRRPDGWSPFDRRNDLRPGVTVAHSSTGARGRDLEWP
jgi:hypothetical protein